MERPQQKEGLGSRATLSLTVMEGIKAQSVHDALDRIFEITGCTNCGFMGIELHVRVLPPDLLRRFDKNIGLEIQQLDGIHGLSLFEGR